MLDILFIRDWVVDICVFIRCLYAFFDMSLMFVLFFCLLLPCFACRLILIDCLTRDFGIWYLIYSCKNILKKCLSLLLFYFSFWCKGTTALGQQTTSNFWISCRIFDGTILWSYIAYCIYQCTITNHLCICVLRNIAICW